MLDRLFSSARCTSSSIARASHSTASSARSSDSDWRNLMAVNLLAPMQITTQLMNLLARADEAHIVNMSSIFGLVPVRGLAAYQASKYGLVGFTLAMRNDYHRKNFGVSVICPGLVKTPMIEPDGPSKIYSKMPRIPAWLCTTPERVAQATVERHQARQGIGRHHLRRACDVVPQPLPSGAGRPPQPRRMAIARRRSSRRMRCRRPAVTARRQRSRCSTSDDRQQSRAGQAAASPSRRILLPKPGTQSVASRFHGVPAGAGHVGSVELAQYLEQRRLVGACARQKRGAQRTRAQACHGDAAVPDLLHQRLRDRNQICLAREIDRHARPRHESCHRCDIEDGAAPARDHGGQESQHQVGRRARTLTSMIASWRVAIQFHRVAEQPETGVIDEDVAVQIEGFELARDDFAGISRRLRSIARTTRGFARSVDIGRQQRPDSGLERAIRTTLAPSAAANLANSAPKPEDAPVTTMAGCMKATRFSDIGGLPRHPRPSLTGRDADLTGGPIIPRNRLLAGRFRPAMRFATRGPSPRSFGAGPVGTGNFPAHRRARFLKTQTLQRGRDD